MAQIALNVMPLSAAKFLWSDEADVESHEPIDLSARPAPTSRMPTAGGDAFDDGASMAGSEMRTSCTYQDILKELRTAIGAAESQNNELFAKFAASYTFKDTLMDELERCLTSRFGDLTATAGRDYYQAARNFTRTMRTEHIGKATEQLDGTDGPYARYFGSLKKVCGVFGVHCTTPKTIVVGTLTATNLEQVSTANQGAVVTDQGVSATSYSCRS